EESRSHGGVSLIISRGAQGGRRSCCAFSGVRLSVSKGAARGSRICAMNNPHFLVLCCPGSILRYSLHYLQATVRLVPLSVREEWVKSFGSRGERFCGKLLFIGGIALGSLPGTIKFYTDNDILPPSGRLLSKALLSTSQTRNDAVDRLPQLFAHYPTPIDTSKSIPFQQAPKANPTRAQTPQAITDTAMGDRNPDDYSVFWQEGTQSICHPIGISFVPVPISPLPELKADL
ncbi:15169_t:CDS:2, partial [Acaulospora colombiana]